MMGYLQIQEARERREKAEGEDFDIKAFNQNALSCYGPMDQEFERCLKMRESLK